MSNQTKTYQVTLNNGTVINFAGLLDVANYTAMLNDPGVQYLSFGEYIVVKQSVISIFPVTIEEDK